MLFALCKGMDVSKSLLGVRVLVVEDDPGSAKLMSLLLTDAGADVQTVADAESAMSALRTFPAELVVLDLVLPGMNGLAMARMLKQRLPHVVIVAVSAINGPNAVAAALDAGCAAYMKKPIDTETFAQSLSKHLGRIK